MKAIVFRHYGPPEVLKLEEVTKPIPKNNEILIKINATAVNSGDWKIRKADPWGVRLFFGLTKPKINTLGVVFSGEVESIGAAVTLFKIGDQVFGHTDMSFGTYAEYKCMPQNGSLAIKPASISHAEAAVIPFGALTALHFIKKANLKQGQKILIVGASGAVGTAAVQLAKSFGAIVTGVCSTANSTFVKSLGADEVIDYTKEDFTKNGEIYDVVFDTVNTISVLRSLKSLHQKGSLILSAAMTKQMLQGFWTSIMTNIKVHTGMIIHNAEAMDFLKQLIETGKLKAVIDRTYSLEQVAEAHRYVELGHKKGNVVIKITD
ncbi:MAG: NAD(P)-dependent alcohol dehydrogenase [Flavobacterium sp.]|uniref:NAD(P)-dependent alcohol dehydrogenase n=1 Tax=Flavobacterium sp. TaxID=239 RepID=UPI0032633A21